MPEETTSNRESEIVSRSIIFSLAQYTSLFGLARGFVVAKLLGPVLFGIRNTFGIIMSFNTYSHLGTLFAMQRDVPYYRGKSEDAKADLIISSTFWVNMLLVTFAGILCIIASFYLKATNWDDNYCILLFFTGSLIISGRLSEFYNYSFQIENKFYVLSRIQLYSKIVTAVSCIALTYFFSLRGFFIGLFIGDLFFITDSFFNIEKKIPSLIVSFQVIKDLMKTGLPMLASGMLFILLINIDKIMILWFLSQKDLGFYGIATIATGVIGTISDSVFSVTLPEMMKKYGKTHDIKRIKNYLIEPTVVLAYFLPFLLASIYFLIHIPIQYYMVKFIPSIKIVKILTLGLFFFAVPTMAHSICIAVNKVINLTYFNFITISISAILNYTFIKLGFGLEGIALGTSISYFIHCTTTLTYAMSQFKAEAKEYIKFFITIYAPFVYASILIIGLDTLSRPSYPSFFSDLKSTSLIIVIFCILYSIIFLFIKNNSTFVKLIEIFSKKLIKIKK